MIKPAKQNEYQPAIVIPAYRRPQALRRLLQSVSQAHYTDAPVLVILSLEAGATDAVKELAKSFADNFRHGQVKIHEHENPLGLRDHIRWCGDRTETNDAVIILEDDLYVDPWFYDFTRKALKEYQDVEKFGGISLYSPRFNEFADLPFEPLTSVYDTFFMQSGSSSGQVWTQKNWIRFREFMDKTDEKQIHENDSLPEQVRYLWPESSWKKYYNAWLVKEDLYMIYPYRSYSTNCSDPSGVHLQNRTSLHQSPLADPKRMSESYRFAPFNEDSICYDAFQEICGSVIDHLLGLNPAETEIDLYGIKPLSLIRRKKKVITSKSVKRSENSYPLMFRPIEQNLLHPDESHSDAFFHLADAGDVIGRKRLDRKTYFRLAEYYIRFSPFKSRFFISYTVKYLQTLFTFLFRKQ